MNSSPFASPSFDGANGLRALGVDVPDGDHADVAPKGSLLIDHLRLGTELFEPLVDLSLERLEVEKVFERWRPEDLYLHRESPWPFGG